MPKRSAGILMYRRRHGELEVFLVHPGGPFWVKKDLGAWTIPKGEYADDEQPLAAAQREFQEETGFSIDGPFLDLGTIRQVSGKLVSAWAAEGDCDPEKLVSNLCEIEWPPRSHRLLEIPEVDRGAWFSVGEARERILNTQAPFLSALVRAEGAHPCDANDTRLATRGKNASKRATASAQQSTPGLKGAS